MAARKRKTPQPTAAAVPATSTPDAAPAVTAEAEPPASPAAQDMQTRSDQPKAFQPDPFPLMSVSLGGDADAPRVRLYRSRRMNQVAVRFDEKPAEPHRQRLRDEGYKWRDAEGVWTKQLGDERASGQLAAERLVVELANAVRAEAGLAPVGRAVGG